jgi:hypothetical protein
MRTIRSGGLHRGRWPQAHRSLGVGLIVRVLRGVVSPDQVQAFHEQASLALQRAREERGLLFGEVGRQARADCSEDVVFVTVWEDLAALYRWIGVNDLLATPLSRDGAHIDQVEVQHYETWGDPADSAAPARAFGAGRGSDRGSGTPLVSPRHP